MRLVAILLALCMTSASGLDQNLLPNAGFEAKSGDDGIAQGWADNSSWADLDVEYQPETANPHSGRACQRIVCSRLTYGAVQMIPTSAVPLERGQIYRVSLWLRGNVGMVAGQVRLAPAPYTVYIERDITVSPEWQQLQYLWTSTVTDPTARFMIRFVQPGSLWVDDVAVQKLTPAEALKSVPPPQKGNLLHNGRFDLGLANWLVSHGCDYWRKADLSIDETDAGPCLRIDVPDGVHVSVASDAAAVAHGHPVRIACRARAKEPTAFSFFSTFCATRAQVGREWQTLRAAGKAGFGKTHGCVRVALAGPCTVWLDDVQLRQDGQWSGREGPSAAIVSERHPLSLYHGDEVPILRLMSAAGPAELNWTVEDFWGREAKSGHWRSGPGRDVKTIACTDLPRGWYRASVAWQHKGRELRNESTFCLLPPRERAAPAATSPFGAHFSLDPDGITLARAVGVRWLRLHPPNHTKWRVVEPHKGEWRWRDEAIRIARDAGFDICGSLDRCPTWASTAPPGTKDIGFYTGTGAWVPRDWREWEDYVARTVRRYRKDIHVWEVWNEPNLTSWLRPREGQTRAQAYVEMLKHTYPIVKREDSSATVIAGCVAGALRERSSAYRFAVDIIDQGALALMDVFSFHEYISRSVDEGDEPIDVQIARLREHMRAAGRELPIINSEGGYSVPGTCLSYRPCPRATVPPDKMARWLVRQYVAQLALGIKQFYFYNFFIDGSPAIRQWQGLVEGDGQPRPNVAAYANMTWLLDGAAFARTDRPAENVWVHRFATPAGPLAVAWSRTETTASLAFPNATEAWSLMGEAIPIPGDKAFTITDAPIYVRCK